MSEEWEVKNKQSSTGGFTRRDLLKTMGSSPDSWGGGAFGGGQPEARDARTIFRPVRSAHQGWQGDRSVAGDRTR